ncbi:uncharacterized protein PRCAT00001033001 [Priceomyces carsonii]|uniref:uncharacterized protein n=1 Tax=Priceomyces carsonii TaxID=28549 RepID=UPI002ED7D5BD|nr:unnamed protein product [Priceomyces carsonii]
MLGAIYITDAGSNLVFEYLINLSSPSFKSLSSILSQKSRPGTESALSLIEINKNYYVTFSDIKGLRLYVLCSNEHAFNPMVPYIFMSQLVDIMEEYFGAPLTSTKIDANSDTLMLLLSEMVDDGIPNITDCNALRDIVPFKSLLSRILSTPNRIAKASSPNPLSQTSETSKEILLIPWRRSNVKYTNNEMYVDVIENLSVILKPISRIASGTLSSVKAFDSAFYSSSNWKPATRLIPISGFIDGKVNFVSHLSGVPMLQMVLLGRDLDKITPSFHRCIKVKNWIDNPGHMSFIPPDGRSTLMNYKLDLDTMNKSYQQEVLDLIDIDYQSGVGVNQNEFQIKLFIKSDMNITKIDNLMIEIHVGSRADNEDELKIDMRDINIKTNRVTHGDAMPKDKGKVEWNLRTVSTGIQAVFDGSISVGQAENTVSFDNQPHTSADLISIEDNVSEKKSTRAPISLKPSFLRLSYSHKGSVPSGWKVDSLKIVSAKGLGDTVKPYKGVKYITKTGNYIIRS